MYNKPNIITSSDKGRVATTTMSDVRTDNTNALNYGYLVNGSVKSISTSNGKFEMTLGFASGMYPSYSGNVSSMSWRGGDGVNRIYNYRYDKLNRLISAEYYEANRASRSDISYMGSPDYDTSYSYDLHGNVKTISRKGMTGLTPGANNMIVSYGNTDNLTLSYTGNRLKSVTDTSSRIYYTGATDFDDAADYDTEYEYEYDYNGNVTVDRNRRIVGAVYNSLNQPMRIEMEDGAEIENMYDADGTLRQRKHIGNDDTEIAVTDYSGVWEFKNGTLNRINIPGGYIQGDSVYFYIADRQGHIRQVWNASTGQTVQDNHYYPYGAMFGESAAVEYVNAMSTNLAGTSVNPYRYGGKEWLMQEGLNYYDFAARQYDPTTGRFIHPDPLNGKYPHLSSYLYCAGNPINATDPSGLAVIYDMTGAYVGTTDEGFTGGIYIYNGTINIDFSKYKEAELKKLKFVKEMGEVGKDLSLGAKLAIFNHVIAHFNGLDIFGEKFSMDRIDGGEIRYYYEPKSKNSKITIWGTEFEKKGDIIYPPKIVWSNDFTDTYEATVENIASSVLVHEWYSHGIMHIGEENHEKAYENVVKFSSLWGKTTIKYRFFVLNKIHEFKPLKRQYKLTETLYINLINKYGK